MPKRFERTIEDFCCEHCGQTVTGNGYTNHCPNCLWSKHVDINPGDRAQDCQGLMEPIGVESRTDQHTILHRCTRCNASRRVKADKNDNFEMLLEIAKRFGKGV